MTQDIQALIRLPGADIALEGIRDLERGEPTQCALLVAMAASRLRLAGLSVPHTSVKRPSHRLYELLAADDAPSAHSRYNALVRRIVSFARAAEHARSS